MKRLVIVGFLIWAVSTLALRLVGQFIFRNTGARMAVPLLVISLPIMVTVALLLLRRLSGAGPRALGAVALVAPGMVLDTISAIWFAAVFPNIRADAAGLFGGWLLFCNVVVLLTGVTIGVGPSKEDRPSTER